MSCKGICKRYRAIKPLSSRYGSGQKRCNICEIYLEFDGIYCPCCGMRLRTNSRMTKLKEKFIGLERI